MVHRQRLGQAQHAGHGPGVPQVGHKQLGVLYQEDGGRRAGQLGGSSVASQLLVNLKYKKVRYADAYNDLKILSQSYSSFLYPLVSFVLIKVF